MKKYKISLISLLCALILAVCALSFTLFASADDTTTDARLVSLNGTNVFYTDVDGAEVAGVRETTGTGENATSNDYAMFKIGDGEQVTFRKNLAYSWYAKNDSGVGQNYKFNLTISFKNATFEKYTIKFQSQQYAKTEDNVTTNYIYFTPNSDGSKVYVTVTDSEDEEASTDFAYNVGERIEIGFGTFSKGVYDIIVNGTDKVGQFKNVKETYSKYQSSGTSACMPLTFTAAFAEGAEEGATANMAIYQMNGQSFELVNATVDDDGNVSGGSVQDTEPPVVCIDGIINYLNFGESIDLDYVVIDVLASNPDKKLNYYILTYEDYDATDFDYENTEADESGNTLFSEVSSSSTLRLLRDETTFIPSYLTDGSEEVKNGGYEVFGLAKIYIYVYDVSGTKGVTDNVFLDWYVADEYKVDIYGSKLKNDSSKSCGFIKIVSDNKGATYADRYTLNDGETVDEFIDAYKQRIEDITKLYQDAVNAAIVEQNPEDKKLYAASSNYFYLPEFSGYAMDNLSGYEDCKYSIYYKTNSSSSNTSLAYNQLTINVTQADVTYLFTIYVTDAEGNSMVYPTKNVMGELVWEELSVSDVWDGVKDGLLPSFTFEVSYKAATVEDPTSQTIGYVGSTYNSVSFDIKGITSTYSTNYNLYTFDREAFAKDTNINLTYDMFMENVEALFNNDYVYNGEKVSSRKYFTSIKAKADLKESDENYDTLIEYAWNKSSVTFVPQSTSEYYVVQLVLTDDLTEVQTKKYMAIRISETPDSLAGENDWLANNIPSVVLLCVAGASFIALIVLLVIKPKDKGDIDTIDTDEKKTKKSKKAKKAEAID